jgi:hypothetical protein
MGDVISHTPAEFHFPARGEHAAQTIRLPTDQGAVLQRIARIRSTGVSHHPHLLDAETKLRVEGGA